MPSLYWEDRVEMEKNKFSYSERDEKKLMNREVEYYCSADPDHSRRMKLQLLFKVDV